MFKKNLLLVFMAILPICFLGCAKSSKMVGMPNPWKECNSDMKCAKGVAGFDFAIIPSENYTIRAMKGMIEIVYPLDEKRKVIVRKSNLKGGKYFISGVYTEYPVNNKIKIKNNISVKIRGTNDKIYVADIGKTYSIYCQDGFTIEELNDIYDLIFAIEGTNR